MIIVSYKYATKSSTYTELRQQSKEFKEKNDCGVMTIAAAGNISYEEAHTLLKAAGRKNRGYVYNHMLINIMTDLGFEIVEVNLQKWMERYPANVRKKRQAPTTSDVARWPQLWKGTFIAFTSGHCLAIVDGENHDWSCNKALRITRLVKFVKK